MTAATIDLTESMVLAGLRTFLLGVLPGGVQVVRGQDNLVGEPQPDNFVVMTATFRRRLSTNVDTWVNGPNPLTVQALQATQADVQLDIHGGDSTNNAQVIATLFRDPYCVAVFADLDLAMRPLNADDGRQVPFINKQGLYEDRWIMTLSLQIDPVVSTNQQFANTLGPVGLIEVDTRFPP